MNKKAPKQLHGAAAQKADEWSAKCDFHSVKLLHESVNYIKPVVTGGRITWYPISMIQCTDLHHYGGICDVLLILDDELS